MWVVMEKEDATVGYMPGEVYGPFKDEARAIKYIRKDLTSHPRFWWIREIRKPE